MGELIVRFLKVLYRIVPFQFLRKMLFDFFCRVVRGHTVIVRRKGSLYKLDLSESIDLSIFLNQYENDVAAAIGKYCVEGSIIFDIGANIGAHTLTLARNVGHNGKVFAFEPTSYAYEKLIGNIRLNKYENISPFRLAFSDKNVASQRIKYRSSWLTDGSSRDSECDVELARLDDWIASVSISHIDAVKLDVDGNEYSVLKGAEATIKRWHPILIMEVWGPNFADPAKNPFKLLVDLGYEFYDLSAKSKFNSLDEMKRKVSGEDGSLLDYSINVVGVFVGVN